MGESEKNQRFKEAKEVRLAILGKRCELCLKPSSVLVGHHVFGRKSGKHSWDACQIRCSECEIEHHQKYSDGNSDESLRIFLRNNVIIANSLQA